MGRVWPVLVPVGLFALTSGLGVWQIQRLHWKEGLLRELRRAGDAPPVPLEAADGAPPRFRLVSVRGVLDPAGEVAYASEVRDVAGVPTFGVFLLEPLRRPAGSTVVVDLGWVPATVSGRPAATVAGDRRVVGYVRPAERPGLFTPAPDRRTRQVYVLDPALVASVAGLGSVAPFTVVALRSGGAAGFPSAADGLPRPPNDHLQYALTWFALAGVTAAMSAAWWRQALRTGRGT